MTRISPGSALGICIALGLLTASAGGRGESALGYVLCLFVGVPVVYLAVISKAAISDLGKWCLTIAVILLITGVFFLW